MKECSKCHQIYSDDELNFCLSDGASLTFVQDSSEETVIRSSPVVHQPSLPAKQGVNPIFAYSTIALLALIMGGAIGFYWLKSDTNPPIANTNLTSNKNNSVSEKTETSPVTPDKSGIEDEIKVALDGWTQTLVKRDFDGHLKYYGAKIEVFYKKKNVDFAFVDDHYRRLFKKYHTFGLSNSNIKIDVDSTRGKGRTVADITFDFKGDNAFYSGVSQTEFQWEKFNGAWKITSEKDLQIYRENKK